ncbi:MAG: serine/threonine-protein kinase [Deltaproteobacteria bacterium]|nr:serine/threonine-protein kinase [Deltaproteobacteria bacterium]
MTWLAIGSVFAGEWRILARIAEGGMGAVYRVEQCSTGQQCALKVLRSPLWDDARARERLAQEAQVVAKIPSEHVARVLSAGVDDERGVPWLAMELLEGETLKQRVDRVGPYERLDALELARQLCHALGAAHDANIVHRDLKPENIFIARSLRANATETVKLLDFGIATVFEAFDTGATATSVIGSPLWMAPEQVRRERIRPATDVWALGLVMFWAMTGKPYWRSTFPADAVLFEKMVEPLVAASVRAKELGCHDAIPPGFDPWFARCVTRNIDERYRDANEAFDFFERVMTDPRMPRELPLSRTRRALVVVGALCVIAAVGATSVPMLTAFGTTQSLPTSVNDAAVFDTESPRDVHRVDAREAGMDASVEAAHDARIANTLDAHAVTGVSFQHAHVVPLLDDFVVRRAQRLSCHSRQRPHGWQVVPNWFLARQAALHLEERTRRITSERAMIARLADPDSQARSRASVDAQAVTLARDRELFETEVGQALPATRTTLATRARSLGCESLSLRADSTTMYAVWCCP